MTIEELIEILEEKKEVHGNIEVMTSSDYGDYSHTEELNYIISVDTCIPEPSAYSRSGMAFPDINDNNNDDSVIRKNRNDGSEILVLRHKN